MSLLLLTKNGFGRSVPTPPPEPVTPDWETYRNFESGTVDALATGSDAFYEAQWNTVYTTEQAHSGTRSAKLRMSTGDVNGMGGRIVFPTNCLPGDTLWLDLWVYLPETYQIESDGTTNPGQLKFLRIQCEDTTKPGNYEGYLDVYLRKDHMADGTFRSIKEGQDIWQMSGPTTGFPRAGWHRVSLYAKADSVARDNGGTSRLMLWLDGVLMADRGSITTLMASTSRFHAFYLVTYWNNGAPQDQHCYADDIRLAKNGRPTWALDLESVP